MKTKILPLMLTLSFLILTDISALTGEEIIRKADNMQVFTSSVSTGEIRIRDRFGLKVSTFNSWTRGKYESLIEFTSRSEKGQKVLRTENELYLYYPDAEELIRMQGSMLRQSMLGSDISYEDMTGGKDRVSQYEVVLEGEEEINGNLSYVLMMTARVRTVPYPKEKVWIDKTTFTVWKTEFYTKSGRLLKEMEVLETREIDGKIIAVKTRISDKMKTDTETVMIITDMKVNIPIDDKIFSLEELSW